jgi:hypothetical protein
MSTLMVDAKPSGADIPVCGLAEVPVPRREGMGMGMGLESPWNPETGMCALRRRRKSTQRSDSEMRP